MLEETCRLSNLKTECSIKVMNLSVLLAKTILRWRGPNSRQRMSNMYLLTGEILGTKRKQRTFEKRKKVENINHWL